MGTPKIQFNCAVLVALVAFPHTAFAQCSSLRKDRVALLTGGFAATQAVAIAARGSDWWPQPRRSFHVVWDASANREQDGFLHTAFGYHTSQLATLAWDWACVSSNTAAWLGAATGVAIGIPKEIGDGFRTGKGFSTRDVAWTVFGAVLPALHRTTPPTRSLSLKIWYWPSSEFRNRLPGALPQLENDYAGQHYFVVFNPSRLVDQSGVWPAWLGLAVGHSVPYWISQPPIHEWYATLDVSALGLAGGAPGWHKIATVLDQIHFPMPGIRIRDGRVAFGLF